MQSKALEINLSDTRVDILIDPKYEVFLTIVSSYAGIRNRMEVFLKELSHPYRNWNFIITEARYFSLQNFYLYQQHPEGEKALSLFVDIYLTAFEANSSSKLKAMAADNLMVFLQQVSRVSDEDLHRFISIFDKSFSKIDTYADDDFLYFIKSYYSPDTIAKALLSSLNGDEKIFSTLNGFLFRFYKGFFDFWLEQEDPLSWVTQSLGTNKPGQELLEILDRISHERIRSHWQKQLNDIIESQSRESIPADTTKALVNLISYQEFVGMIGDIPLKIRSKKDNKIGDRYTELIFLFYIIHTPGLFPIHVRALRDINTTLAHLIDEDKDFDNTVNVINKTFSLFKEYRYKYPETVLDCIKKIGEAIYKTADMDLINHFIDRTVEHGFQFPMITGTGEDWQIKSNAAHVKNIRVALELISLDPRNSKRLFSGLIIALAIGGVYIKDTDLFPRDITRFLNSDIEPVFNLVKQLSRLLPAFFNEIGAEGPLRDISTDLDESCRREDRLIHFLRKQCHVESSSRIVDFINEVILFWKTGHKEPLRSYLPPSIYEETDVFGPFTEGPRIILSSPVFEGMDVPEDYLIYTENALNGLIDSVEGVDDREKSRVKMIFGFYRLLIRKYRKYRVDNPELTKHLSSVDSEHLPDSARLIKALEENSLEDKIKGIIAYMQDLKAVILSNEVFKINEAIYRKRHVAVDIPSTYGSYNEAKFDALGLTLRTESILNVLFEELINSIDLQVITKSTFKQLYSIIKLFRDALALDGIKSNRLNVQIDFLKSTLDIRTCTISQYLDIFKGLNRAQADIINDHFNSIHISNILNIVPKIEKKRILKKYLPDESEKVTSKLAHRVAEIFSKDRIATSIGLQQFDLFLSRILHTLIQQSEKLSPVLLSKLLNYDPNASVTEIGSNDPVTNNIINLGNKGLNLSMLKKLAINVPEGFIITTEVFKCREIINNYKPARISFKNHVRNMIAGLEKRTGKKFGKPPNPLLLSVRSGSSISQPGMMDSFLNIGINEDIVASLANNTGNPWFAWDSYRRFLQGYGMACGLKRDTFDELIRKKKKQYNVKLKRYLNDSQMQEVASLYKELLAKEGFDMLDSPFDQLFMAIDKVFDSWESQRAKDYRRIMGISDDWGTAVTVQSMVFGNLSYNAGSGVVFSHSPKLPGDTIRLWGDFTHGNQGEDVVSGLVKTLPISEMQRAMEVPDAPTSLEIKFPQIYNELQRIIYQLLYDEQWNPMEIEFTFEGPSGKDFYILQTRDMSLRDQKLIKDFDPNSHMLEKAYLGQGIGVSGGAMCGRIVFSLEEINTFRSTDPDAYLILLRNDTVPDDILEIEASDGILTARGGLTSHAAVVTYNLGKTCIVGYEKLVCKEREKECMISGIRMVSGDYISINGQKGTVYKGTLPII